MRLFHKIFLCFVVIFSITFQVAGFLLVNFAYENTINQEKKYAIQEYQYNKYILQSLIFSEEGLLNENGAALVSRTKNFTTAFAVYEESLNCLFSNLTVSPALKFTDIREDTTCFQMYKVGNESYIFVYGSVNQNEKNVYLVSQTNISQAVNVQREMLLFFQKVFLIILCIAFPIIFLLSDFLTRNIAKVNKGSKRIAEGNYSERIPVSGKDEIRELADGFNQMAEKVEEKVKELSDIARQKEDFAANFAHELKTPLTSVIGYADMLYQKDLPREQVRNAAEYILNEGMRLESLSLKLMDLFILEKQDFYLESMNTGKIFADLTQDMNILCVKKNVEYHLDIEAGIIKVEFDLFKTLIINLIDNALKADCKDIWISGKAENRKYQILFKDNGKGIPPKEIEHITEAFYTVDKSRSRKQHGAGLGMALVSKIAEIHEAHLHLYSDGRTGTTIELTFQDKEA